MNPGLFAGISSFHKKIWLLAALTLLCYIPFFARLWVYALPLFSFLLAVQLIRKDKSAYIEFVVWLCILVPSVRRYVDYRIGAQETSIMVAPYLAVAVCLWTIFPRWTEVLNTRNASLILLNGSLSSRLFSLRDTNDDSANDRTKIYEAVFHSVATSPFGLGLGVVDDSQTHDSISDAKHDSSVVNLLLSFGVVGSIVFGLGFVGISWLILWASRDASATSILFVQASLFALIAESPLNNILTGPIASLTGCVIGLGCATMEARIDSWQNSFSDQLPAFAQPKEIF